MLFIIRISRLARFILLYKFLFKYFVKRPKKIGSLILVFKTFDNKIRSIKFADFSPVKIIPSRYHFTPQKFFFIYFKAVNTSAEADLSLFVFFGSKTISRRTLTAS